MEVFLRCGEGDKKFIVFPAREMSADSLSCPPCKTSPDSALRITHYVYLCTQCVHIVHSGTVELAGIRRKETKRLGVPPTLINIKSLRRLLDWTRPVFYLQDFEQYDLCRVFHEMVQWKPNLHHMHMLSSADWFVLPPDKELAVQTVCVLSLDSFPLPWEHFLCPSCWLRQMLLYSLAISLFVDILVEFNK